MKNQRDLDPVWDAVLARLEREGFSASDVLRSMLRAAMAGLIARLGFKETAALTVTALRELQPDERAAA